MSKSKKFIEVGDFIGYEPTSEDISLAHQRAKDMGVLPNSYTRGLGRMVGCLGEIVVNNYLPRSKYTGDTSYTHDIRFRKKEIEIKSKTCSSEPQPNYSAFVNCSKNFKFQNDIYFFTRVRRDLMYAWLVGWLPTKKLLNTAHYVNRGDTDKDGFKFKSSGLHLEISSLNKPKDLLKI